MSELAFRPHRRRRRGVLNITSLIDVLFLLLIFFMLTSTFRRGGQLNLTLPESTTASPLLAGESQAPLELTLLEDGRVLLDASPVRDDDLPSILRARVEADPSARILLQAEAAARHADVVHLLDLVREAGFVGIGIGTEMRTFSRPGESGP